MQRVSRRASVLVAAAACLVAATAVVGTVYGVQRLNARDGPELPSGRLRYLNVTIDVPELPLRASLGPQITDTPNPSFSHRPAIRVSSEAEVAAGVPAELVIDAETGEVLLDSLSQVYPVEVQMIIGSVELSTELADLWPFTDATAPDATQTWGNISYVIPDQGSGMHVSQGANFCRPPCAEYDIIVVYRDSSMMINAVTGEVVWSRVTPELDEAFDRFATAVVVRPNTPEPAP